MKIYLVCDGSEYEEGDNSDSVWSTAEMAQRRCDELITAGHTSAFWDEMELDQRPERDFTLCLRCAGRHANPSHPLVDCKTGKLPTIEQLRASYREQQVSRSPWVASEGTGYPTEP